MMHVHAWRPAVLAALAIPALVLCAAPASAQTTPYGGAERVVHQSAVHYGDLDLTTTKGRATLERRLRETASSVCEFNRQERNDLGNDDARRCYTTALTQAHNEMAGAISKTRIATRQ